MKHVNDLDLVLEDMNMIMCGINGSSVHLSTSFDTHDGGNRASEWCPKLMTNDLFFDLSLSLSSALDFC